MEFNKEFFKEFFSANKRIILPALLAVLSLIAIGVFIFYSQSKTQSPEENLQEVKNLVAEVGKLIDLPSGEDPTVATVTDVTKLADQPFFQKAKNGDKVLIYTRAKKAILYDPKAKKVIDVAPINIGSPSAQASIKVVLRNGTTTTGLTSKVEPEVKKSLPDAQIVAKENAAKDDYQYSLVVILNDGFRDQAVKLAKDLEASMSGLPTEEIRPKDADILVILGKNIL